MLPILLQIGFVKIYTFGVFLVLALFWGAFFLWKNIRLTAFKEEEVFDGLIFALIGGAFVGRLMYVVLHFSDFGFNIVRFILINGYPGFSLVGFLIGFFLAYLIFARTQKLRYMELIDYVIPAVFLALAIGKVGSFFAGVEVGTQTSLPVAIKYANFDGMRHLTPLYESILLFIGSFFAFRIMFTIRREALSRGFLLWFFIWYTSGVYLAFDWIREGRVMIYNYSFYAGFSLVLLLTLSIYFLYYFRTAILQSLIGSFQKKHVKSSHPGVHSKSKEKTARGKK